MIDQQSQGSWWWWLADGLMWLVGLYFLVTRARLELAALSERLFLVKGEHDSAIETFEATVCQLEENSKCIEKNIQHFKKHKTLINTLISVHATTKRLLKSLQDNSDDGSDQQERPQVGRCIDTNVNIDNTTPTVESPCMEKQEMQQQKGSSSLIEYKVDEEEEEEEENVPYDIVQEEAMPAATSDNSRQQETLESRGGVMRRKRRLSRRRSIKRRMSAPQFVLPSEGFSDGGTDKAAPASASGSDSDVSENISDHTAQGGSSAAAASVATAITAATSSCVSSGPHQQFLNEHPGFGSAAKNLSPSLRHHRKKKGKRPSRDRRHSKKYQFNEFPNPLFDEENEQMESGNQGINEDQKETDAKEDFKKLLVEQLDRESKTTSNLGFSETDLKDLESKHVNSTEADNDSEKAKTNELDSLSDTSVKDEEENFFCIKENEDQSEDQKEESAYLSSLKTQIASLDHSYSSQTQDSENELSSEASDGKSNAVGSTSELLNENDAKDESESSEESSEEREQLSLDDLKAELEGIDTFDDFLYHKEKRNKDSNESLDDLKAGLEGLNESSFEELLQVSDSEKESSDEQRESDESDDESDPKSATTSDSSDSEKHENDLLSDDIFNLSHQNRGPKEEEEEEEEASKEENEERDQSKGHGTNDGPLILDWAAKADINIAGLRRAKKTPLTWNSKKKGKVQFEMEDAHVVEFPLFENANVAFVGVMDGHASKFAAEAARNLMPKILHRQLLQHSDSHLTDLTDVFLKVFAELDSAMKEFEFEGTTATAVVVWRTEESGERFVQAANVGDSSAFLKRGADMVKLTYDHKVTDDGERQRIISQGIELAPGATRINGLAVSRALGDHFVKENNLGLSGVPYVCSPIRLTAEDTFLIVASDGLWDVVSPQRVADLVEQQQQREDHPHPHPHPHHGGDHHGGGGVIINAGEVAQKLLTQACSDHKCTDNVTVVTLCL